MRSFHEESFLYDNKSIILPRVDKKIKMDKCWFSYHRRRFYRGVSVK